MTKAEIDKGKQKHADAVKKADWIQDREDQAYLDQFDEDKQKQRAKDLEKSKRILSDPRYREAYMRQTRKREQKDYGKEVKRKRAEQDILDDERDRKAAEANKSLWDKATEGMIALTKKIPGVGDVVNQATQFVHDKLKGKGLCA